MRKKERCINLAKALFVLLNLLKPCFLVFGKSCSLHKHHQAIRLFPCQNKHRKKERAEAEVKKKERKEREGAANKIWFNILDKKNIFFSKKSTFLVSKREFSWIWVFGKISQMCSLQTWILAFWNFFFFSLKYPQLSHKLSILLSLTIKYLLKIIRR